MERGESQKTKVLTWIKEVGPITPLEALKYFGSFRLAAIINKLRNENYRIRTEIVEEDGKHFAKYHYEGKLEDLVKNLINV